VRGLNAFCCCRRLERKEFRAKKLFFLMPSVPFVYQLVSPYFPVWRNIQLIDYQGRKTERVKSKKRKRNTDPSHKCFKPASHSFSFHPVSFSFCICRDPLLLLQVYWKDNRTNKLMKTKGKTWLTANGAVNTVKTRT